MENKKPEAKVREEIVHDLSKAKTFTLKGEPGFKIQSLKQKVADVSFIIDENAEPSPENTITTTATTLKLATQIDRIQVVIPADGKWMMTYPDTFEFYTADASIAEFKVIIMRQEPRPMRERRPRINREERPYTRSSYRSRENRPYRQSDEISSLNHVSGKDVKKENY